MYKFELKDFPNPSFSIKHVDLSLSFFDTSVEGSEVLTIRAPEALSSSIILDAQDLTITGAEFSTTKAFSKSQPLTFLYNKKENKLELFFPTPIGNNSTFYIKIDATCRPTDNILEGLYFDVAPEGAPPQIISQCQQWGFQRIMPFIDDCRAKCTWRTTIEASSAYTHLISNGDVCKETNPRGVPEPLENNTSRKRITYVNNIPMPPYLFVAAVGTWEEVSDFVVLPNGRKVKLEYLVPPGKANGAKLPLEILKAAVVWQAKRLNYEYLRECYRTICMEKSNFGGMENVGNTTIITEAAIIDQWTTDARLVYANAVIVHEFEHNHCGSDVTMATPFDMWLNEAFTVNIEREYQAEVFGAEYMRLYELDSIRDPSRGPLYETETGTAGRIVRTGFDHPDDVVDGTTYVKAPEVLDILAKIIGKEAYERGTTKYFERYFGGNASTADFLRCIAEEAPKGCNIYSILDFWLHYATYPVLTLGWKCNEKDSSKLDIVHTATPYFCGEAIPEDVVCHIPMTFTPCAKDGTACGPTQKTILTLTQGKDGIIHTATPTLECDCERLAYVDYHPELPFFGRLKITSLSPEAMRAAILHSSNPVLRAELMHMYTDAQCIAYIKGEATSKEWLELFPTLLDDPATLIKARLLSVSESFLSSDYLNAPEKRHLAAKALRKAVAESIGENALIEALKREMASCDETEPSFGELPRLIPQRALRSAIAQLLAALGTDSATKAIADAFHSATNITDKLNYAAALNKCDSSWRKAVIDELGKMCRPHIAAYSAYLRILASGEHSATIEELCNEANSGSFSPSHPTHSRALYGGFTSNNAMIWTKEGLALAKQLILELADLNEYVAIVVVAPLLIAQNLEEPLRAEVISTLNAISQALEANPGCHSLKAKLKLAL